MFPVSYTHLDVYKRQAERRWQDVAYKSITKRWLMNNLGVIMVVLIAVTISVSFAIHNYYYSSVLQILQGSADYGDKMVQTISNNSKSNLNSEIRDLVETYDKKDQIEMMAIDHQGNIVVTSSGFSYLSLADKEFADLSGEELKNAISEKIKAKDAKQSLPLYPNNGYCRSLQNQYQPLSPHPITKKE